MTHEINRTVNITLDADLEPNETVSFVFLRCRTCGEQSPVERVDNDAGYPGGPWDYNHGKATGHKKFYLFTLSRTNATLF